MIASRVIDVPKSPAQYGAAYNRLLRQRYFVRGTQIGLGAIAAFTYQAQIGFSHYAFWRSSGFSIVAIVVVPIWPYGLSCIVSWWRTTSNWARPWVFCLIQIAITGLACFWYLSKLNRQIGILGNIAVTMFQAAAFVYLAEWTFE